MADLEQFAKTIPNLMAAYCAASKVKLDPDQIKSVHRSLLGIYGADPAYFEFHKSEEKLILRIAKFVLHKVKLPEDYSFFWYENWSGEESFTVETPIGVVFDERGKEKERRKVKREISSPRGRYQVQDGLENDIGDLAIVKKALIDCCSMRARHVIREYCNEHREESDFLSMCGSSLKKLNLRITINDSDLNCCLDTTMTNIISGSIQCYCNKRIACYFRGKANWLTVLSEDSHIINSLSKSWNLGNFKTHLKLHKKFLALNAEILLPKSSSADLYCASSNWNN